MKVLIVFAHPEPRSLNGFLRDYAVTVLESEGHQVKTSDLYAMKFKASARNRHRIFPIPSLPEGLISHLCI